MGDYSQRARILLVEDSADDIEVTMEAFRAANFPVDLAIVRDGDEALNHLRSSENPIPDLILLDLNMPRKTGLDVLSELERDPALRVIPVVVLTTASSEDDVLGAYRNHANCYINKPDDFKEFIKVVRSIETFWFTVAKLPPKPIV